MRRPCRHSTSGGGPSPTSGGVVREGSRVAHLGSYSAGTRGSEIGFPPLVGGQTPPSTQTPPPFRPPSFPAATLVLQEEVKSRLAKQAVESVEDLASPGYCHRLCTVPKRTGRTQARLGPFPLESFPHEGTVQDGDSTVLLRVSTTRGLGYVVRPHRRILPYLDTPQRTEVAALQGGGETGYFSSEPSLSGWCSVPGYTPR